MPGPVALAPSRFFHLNVRVPRDIADRVRGATVTLPVAGLATTVKISDKVVVSLRTRDVREARTRFLATFAALDAHWEAVRRGPTPLTHRQVVALAGDHYRAVVSPDREDEPGDIPARQRAHNRHVEALRLGPKIEDADDAAAPEFAFGEPGPLQPADAAYLARLIDFGPHLMTFLHGDDLSTPDFSMRYGEALEFLFGTDADAVCARRGLQIADGDRQRLLRQIGMAAVAASARLKQLADGDYSPDPHLARFPPFDRETRVTVATLFTRWREGNAAVVEPSTVRRYTPSLNSLAAFVRDKDVRRINQDDIWAWAEHRRDHDGIAPATVNRNDLVAAASVFTFATTRDGKRLRADNPVTGVRLVEPKRKATREPFFKPTEVKAILLLARGAAARGAHQRQAASRRWVPWICAYSGARVQEPCWLKKSDIWQDDDTGIWVMRFPQTKTGRARTVPLHEALIAEGFLHHVSAAEDGFLFVDDRPARKGEGRTLQEQRASQIAEWIRDHVDLEPGVDPNHGWRHTFITRATGKMEERIQHAICGHNMKRNVADGYFTATIEEMKAGLDKFPPFKL